MLSVMMIDDSSTGFLGNDQGQGGSSIYLQRSQRGISKLLWLWKAGVAGLYRKARSTNEIGWAACTVRATGAIYGTSDTNSNNLLAHYTMISELLLIAHFRLMSIWMEVESLWNSTSVRVPTPARRFPPRHQNPYYPVYYPGVLYSGPRITSSSYLGLAISKNCYIKIMQ